MQFQVIQNSARTPSEGNDIAYLHTDNWNDWFKYRTLYQIVYFDKAGQKHDLGSVKIGQLEMVDGQDRPDLPESFEKLDDRFFSLGQDVDYYSTVVSLGPDVATAFLSALRDIVADADLYQEALEEDVTEVSLLRSVSTRTIEGQFRRILSGGAALTPYEFRYRCPASPVEDVNPVILDFSVKPDSRPPTNIHVLIGRNGVGKTYILNAMTRSLTTEEPDNEKNGVFTTIEWMDKVEQSPFANLLSVTFSAFDEFQIVPQPKNTAETVRYTNIGLRKQVQDKKGQWVTVTRDPVELAKEFSSSASQCVRGSRIRRWRTALTTLEADPLFAEAEVASLANIDESAFIKESEKLYRKLSSGHKIVLLTITKLVEHVEEKTLVMMDEPEAHLHPPLLAAFVRALSDLLTDRNGVAVIATHSPVVLQEVPRSCVWKVIRHGIAADAVRPDIETFGESIGMLTREIFGLEVTRSGFHKMLSDSTEGVDSSMEVLMKFDNEVGSEGRALISSLLALKKSSES